MGKRGAFGTNEAFGRGEGACLGGLERSQLGCGDMGALGSWRCSCGRVQTGLLGTRS